MPSVFLCLLHIHIWTRRTLETGQGKNTQRKVNEREKAREDGIGWKTKVLGDGRGEWWIGERFSVAVCLVWNNWWWAERAGSLRKQDQRTICPHTGAGLDLDERECGSSSAQAWKEWCFWPVAIEANTILKWKGTLHLQLFVCSKLAIFRAYAEPFSFCCALHCRMSWHEQICSAGFGIS